MPYVCFQIDFCNVSSSINLKEKKDLFPSLSLSGFFFYQFYLFVFVCPAKKCQISFGQSVDSKSRVLKPKNNFKNQNEKLRQFPIREIDRERGEGGRRGQIFVSEAA